MLTMKHSVNPAGKRFADKIKMNVAVNIAAFILLFLTVLFYTETVMFEDQEVTALLMAYYLFAGVYTGRYITLLWVHRFQTIPNWIFVFLLALIILCLVWILLHPHYLTGTNTLLTIVLFAFPLLLISLSAGMLVKLVRLNVQRQLESAKAQAAHSESELQLLQSQLSPHFLFNTLNNMYGLSITKPEKVPSLLLKLSDLLRYSVYEVKEKYVPLKNEIAYLTNYIEFEKIRIGEKFNLTVSIAQVEEEAIQIAPMLLIVYVENAFKYARNADQSRIFVAIDLQVKNDYLFFSVKNSCNPANIESELSKKQGGLGLVNARKRLDLLYANAYELSIGREENTYAVNLQLKLR